MMMMPLMFKEGMKMALMFGVSCVDPAAGPGGQRQCGPLRIGQAGREAGAGLRVPDEQGPASVGHHHQPPGQTPHARPRPGGPGLTGSFVFTFTWNEILLVLNYVVCVPSVFLLSFYIFYWNILTYKTKWGINMSSKTSLHRICKQKQTKCINNVSFIYKGNVYIDTLIWTNQPKINQ